MSSYTESEEYKKRLLEKQNAFLERVAKSNGQTVEQLTNYGNNAELLDKAANGEAVTISTPNTDAKKAAYYSQQAATPVSSYYDFLAKNALDTKGVTYAMAEKMRQESEALAEIQRKRSIVDASTMAEQQKATYGANAEQVGRMGLQVSGYSDYLNSQAYAAGMAGRQAANAQATDANRKALYTEQMAKLEADKEYNNALAQIETAKYNEQKALEERNYAEQKALEERNYAEQKEKEAAKQTAYSSVINTIYNNGGTLTADDVAVLAKANGVNDAKTIEELKGYATSYAKNMGMTEEEETTPTTSNYGSIEEIEQARHDLSIDAETRDAEIAKKNTIASNQIDTFIADNKIAEGNAKADELYNSNQMDKTTYQAKKAELAQKNIEEIESVEDVHIVAEDLKKMLKKEQITQEEYNKKITDMSTKAKSIIKYGNVNMGGIKVSKGTTTDSYMRTITIDGNDYDVKLNTTSSQMKSVLENERPNTATITEYDGKYYLYDTIKKNWFVITPYIDPSNPRVTNNAFYDKIKTKVK